MHGHQLHGFLPCAGLGFAAFQAGVAQKGEDGELGAVGVVFRLRFKGAVFGAEEFGGVDEFV